MASGKQIGEMTSVEIRQEDKDLRAERKVLNDRMAELIKKRDAYAAEQRKKAPAKLADSFDRAVSETLRAQIKR